MCRNFTGVTVDFLSKRSAVTRRDSRNVFLESTEANIYPSGKHLSKVTKWKLYVLFSHFWNIQTIITVLEIARVEPCWFSRQITSCVIRWWNAFQRLSQWPLRRSGSDRRRVNNDQISFLLFFFNYLFSKCWRVYLKPAIRPACYVSHPYPNTGFVKKQIKKPHTPTNQLFSAYWPSAGCDTG